MVEQKKEDLFAVVGAGAQSYVSVKKKRSFRERIKGKPVFSAALLLLIVLGCVFAPVFANHDPAGFTWMPVMCLPARNFISGRILWGVISILSCSTAGGRP